MPYLKNFHLTAFPKPPDHERELSVGPVIIASSSSVLDVMGGGKNLSLQKGRMESATVSAMAGRGILVPHDMVLHEERIPGLT